MFRANEAQQLTLGDSFAALTERERRFLDRSWARYFGDVIFPAIDEAPFAALYADAGSRPNTPVNVVVGALIIKELLGCSDDELVESLMFDVRLQYALHTTSMREQPLSDKTLSRFRARCYEHERETGEDLVHGCVTALAALVAGLMGVDDRVRRVDSTMIEASIRRLGRAELVWRCVEGALRGLGAAGGEVPAGLAHYLEEGDMGRLLRQDGGEGRLLREAGEALALCEAAAPGAGGTALLGRCLGEQTVVEGGERRLRTREEFSAGSSALQSPADPDATFRVKRGEAHVGYVCDLEESVGPAGSVVTDYQVEPNNVSDPAMLGSRLGAEGRSGGRRLMVADGAYSGPDLARLADARNVELVCTDLSGRAPNPLAAAFEFSEDGLTMLSCPAGRAPLRQRLDEGRERVCAAFDAEACRACPHAGGCRRQESGRTCRVWCSWRSKARAEAAARLGEEGFQALRDLRSGAETPPSLLKNAYGAARMRVRGLVPTRLSVGCKVAALNVAKLVRFMRGGGRPPRCGGNPVVLGAYGIGAA